MVDRRRHLKPWFGARIATSAEALRAQDIASRLAEAASRDVQRAIDEVFAEVTLRGERVSDWGTVLDTVGRVRDTLEVFRPEVFDIPLGDLVAATGTKEFRETSGVALGWYARWRLRRQARGLLRPGTPPADLHGALVDAQRQRQAWQHMAGAGRPEIPADLDRARTAYDDLAEDLTGSVTAGADGGRRDLLDADLPGLQERMAGLAARRSGSR